VPVDLTESVFMSDRARFVRVFVFLTFFGVSSLLGMLGRPSLQTIRTVDVVHLVGTGMCFGAAIMALVLFLRSPR
jgi:hypothetical protein